jgi:hypothetical protein
MNDITQIIYTSDSGTILPELQWHEVVVITKDEVSLARNGRVENSEINSGVWKFPVDEQRTAALFAQLRSVDCSKIKKVEPDIIPDGGGTESFTIVYTDNQKCSLIYDPGIIYTNGQLIKKPIEEFIQNLAFPSGVENRYK